MNPALRTDFWHQSTPFTCGPAALGSVLSRLGWRPGQPRRDEELDLWRETAAIACPGSHPLAIALAARRRGFAPEVYLEGPRPWLWTHIAAKHPPFGRRAYSVVESRLVRQCEDAGLVVHRTPSTSISGDSGLLLTTAHDSMDAEPDPHWVGLVRASGSTWVADPMRTAPYRSLRSLGEWWRTSGFDSTRCWVAVDRAAGGSRTPLRGVPPAPQTGRPSPEEPPGGGEPHHHHHHPHPGATDAAGGAPLERRAWGREEALRVLESPERRRTQDPAALWNRVGLAAGATVVDVGAGTGFFAIEAARRVGPEGRVYAVDLSGELVELLRERRTKEGLMQLEPVQNTIGHIPLDSGIADFVLMANVLHDVPPSTVSEAIRLMKPKGRLVNLDWKKEPTPGGPPVEIRLTPAEAAAMLGKHGLRPVDEWELGPYHYALVLTRSRSLPPHGKRGTQP